MSTVPHYLPEGAQWVQLGLSILTSVATAGAVVVYGLFQIRVAREKLRHDLYDRRFKVYLAFHDLIMAVHLGQPVKFEDAWKETWYQTPNSTFLFDEEIHKKLLDIRFKAHKVHTFLGPPENKVGFEVSTFEKGQKEAHTDFKFLQKSFDGLTELLSPYMKLRDLSRFQDLFR